jgi:REP element-mobilizing transposase RayT
MHALWTLPEGDSAYARRWNAIKTNFSRNIPPAKSAPPAEPSGERGIWQRWFWEHTIPSRGRQRPVSKRLAHRQCRIGKCRRTVNGKK